MRHSAGPLQHHVDIFAKPDVVVGLVHRSIGITFDVVINADFLVPNHLFEIIPGPLIICRPLLCKVSQHNRYTRFVILFFKILVTDLSYFLNRL